MIRQLLRENVRAHRTYLIWTTVLLTVAVGMASFATFSATQAHAVERHVAEAYGMDGSVNGYAYLTDDEHNDPWVEVVTLAQVHDAVDQANDEGAGATAKASLDIFVSTGTASSVDDPLVSLWSVAALTGDADWGALLSSGSAPQRGEVAVSSRWASETGTELGDTLTVTRDVWADELDEEPLVEELGTLTVSGLLRDSLIGAYEISLEEAFLNWDDAAMYATMAHEGAYPVAYAADISADAAAPGLESFASAGGATTYRSLTASASVILAIGAGVLAAGLIGMAFAVGRSQAQARTGWVATARVLGARKSSLTVATMLEVLAVGALAGVVGSAAGASIIALDWSSRVSSQPDSLVPDGVWLPWWAWLALVGLALVIACIVGGIPAFWAAHTAPAAALKPVTPATQAEVSRTVRVWPLVTAWVLLTVAFLAIWHGSSYSTASWIAGLFTGLGAIVTTVALTVEATRVVVSALARGVAAGARPWAIAAGASLQGRPKQAAGPAAVLALATAPAVGVITWIALAHQAETSSWSLDGSLAGFSLTQQVAYLWWDVSLQTVLTVIAVGFATLVAVALGAFVSLRQATSAETDAHSALGLDAREARTAATAQFSLPLLAGVAVGTILGVVAAVSIFKYWLWTPTEVSADGSASYNATIEIGPWWALTHLQHSLVSVAAVLAIALTCVAIGASVAALTTRVTARPLERTSA